MWLVQRSPGDCDRGLSTPHGTLDVDVDRNESAVECRFRNRRIENKTVRERWVVTGVSGGEGVSDWQHLDDTAVSRPM